MDVQILGHAAVVLEASDGYQLLVDPYEPGGFGGQMAYPPITVRPDAVVCTHDHADHSSVTSVPGSPTVFDGDGQVGPFSVRRFSFHHDEYDGRRFGGSVDVVSCRADGLHIVHGADIGQSPTGRLPDELHRPDLWMPPVGGLYTTGPAQAREWCRRLGARLVLPLHYKTPACGLALGPVEAFLVHFPANRVTSAPADGARIDLVCALRNLTEQGRVIVPTVTTDPRDGCDA